MLDPAWPMGMEPPDGYEALFGPWVPAGKAAAPRGARPSGTVRQAGAGGRWTRRLVHGLAYHSAPTASRPNADATSSLPLPAAVNSAHAFAPLHGCGSMHFASPLAEPGALALGASIVDVGASSAAFAMVAELVGRQPPFAPSSGVAVSVLRVLQCCSHLPSQLLPPQPLSRAPLPTWDAAGGSPSAVSGAPRLAFVLGDDLGAISDFVRSGLRLLHVAARPSRTEGLVLAHQLDARSCWRGGGLGVGLGGAGAGGGDGQWGRGGERSANAADAATGATPALSVWRLVLAICWPPTAGQASPVSVAQAVPAFIVDYAVEKRSAQLVS